MITMARSPRATRLPCLNLLRLAEMTNREAFREAAQKSLRAFAPRMAGIPSGVPQMLVAYDFQSGETEADHSSGCASTPDTAEMLHRLHERFAPPKIVMLVGMIASEDAAAGSR